MKPKVKKGKEPRAKILDRVPGRHPLIRFEPLVDETKKQDNDRTAGSRFLIEEGRLQGIIKEHFINEGNEEETARVLRRIMDIGIGFKNSRHGRNPVVDFRDPEAIRKSILEPMPQRGKPIDKLLTEFERKIVSGAVNFSSPNFMAFPDCGNSLAGVGAHILSGFLNQNLINSFHTSPTATYVEMTVINWLREAVGYAVSPNPGSIMDVGGISVPGGVMANTVGMLLARESRFPGTMKDGVAFDPSKVKVFIPHNISHYSSRAAMGWLGLGTGNMVDVRTTDQFTIDQDDLLRKLDLHEGKGDIPLALVAYCGDSRTMAIDDFPALSRIAKERGMWFHIDACHGLSLCFTKNMRSRVEGIRESDSITVDPHKVLFAPYPLSFILVKEPSRFGLVAGVSDLITKEEFSFGQITPFLGSRAFNSLKLWMLIKNLGSETIGELIEHRHGIAQHFSDRIRKVPGFYPMNEVSINNLAYLFVPEELREALDNGEKWAIERINRLNLRIQSRIFKEGEYYVHTFQLNDFMDVLGTGTQTLFQMQRLSIGNPLTTKEVIDGFVVYLEKTCRDEWEIMREGSCAVEEGWSWMNR